MIHCVSTLNSPNMTKKHSILAFTCLLFFGVAIAQEKYSKVKIYPPSSMAQRNELLGTKERTWLMNMIWNQLTICPSSNVTSSPSFNLPINGPLQLTTLIGLQQLSLFINSGLMFVQFFETVA